MRAVVIAAIAFALSCGVLMLCAAHAQPPAAAPNVARGEWRFQEIDGPGRRRICVRRAGDLLSVDQPVATCRHAVVVSDRRSMVSHYACAGVGSGRSVVTVLDPAAIRLETQGVTRGAPYAAEYDGRWVGRCGAAR